MTTMPPAQGVPLAPFSQWPVQAFLPDHGFYWYVQPAAVVCQTTIAHATIAIVDAHNDMLDSALAARKDEIAKAGGLLIFNDWRSLRGFETGARARMQERMKARKQGYSRKTVVTVNPSNRLLRMTIEAANLFKALAFNARIDVVLSPDAALAEANLSPPLGGSKFPGLR